MAKLRIAFIGLGSIGTRHLKNTVSYLNEKQISFEIDVYRSNISNPIEESISSCISRYYSIYETIADEANYDVVFITNPTSLHYETLKRFQYNGKAFFIEKPVFDSKDCDLDDFSMLDMNKCYVACPLRYSAVIEYVKKNIDVSKVYSVRAISSSYLPDWRPNSDYRKCYSAHANMGGGVDIDLIHEWDYLTYIFGDMEYGYCISDKISNLEIESNDIAVYVARNKDVAVELHLDYFGRKTKRELEMFMEDETVMCDMINGTVGFLKSGKTIEFKEDRNNYQMKEIKHFFDIVLGNINSDSTIEHALKVLHYAKGDF